MTSRRQLILWFFGAVIACALLVGILFWYRRAEERRFATYLAGDPRLGAEVFERKGCESCHSLGAKGNTAYYDLSVRRQPQSSLNELVAGMWNHAPLMWQAMEKKGLRPAAMSPQEMAHLFAYLYTARYVDQPGDADRGHQLFADKQCIRCHSIGEDSGGRGPNLSSLPGVDTPIAWAEAMWNHAPNMEGAMQEEKVAWPKFEPKEMGDLLAFVRENTTSRRHESDFLPADAGHGWQMFQEKGCLNCHTVKGVGGHIGPSLDAPGRAPSTMLDFAGAMWNHSPHMLRAMQKQSVARPKFEGKEMADLLAFLNSLRYFDPVGSPYVGATRFNTRGCARCHGADAAGGPNAPSLRGRSQPFSSISLATALWLHGPEMYRKTQQSGLPWPKIEQEDVGDLLSFLNSPPDGRHQ